jgi:glutamate-5-semialdehyde dehydrogenase
MLENQMREIGESAKKASYILAGVSTEVKNQALQAMARALEERVEMIIDANRQDMDAGRAKGLSDALLDRLLLTPERIKGMAEGLRELIGLPDPVGEVTNMRTRPNGLRGLVNKVPHSLKSKLLVTIKDTFSYALLINWNKWSEAVLSRVK